jgi:glycine dehydrogenase subunit 1
MVTAATIFMSLLGPEGLRRIAALCHARTELLVEAVAAVDGVEIVFPVPRFHEVAIRLPVPVNGVLERMRESGVLGGVCLGPWYSDLDNTLLVCATETKTEEDIETYAGMLRAAIEASGEGL